MKPGSGKAGSEKKRKRRKPDKITRIYAAITAGVLILLALAVSLTAFYLRSVNTQNRQTLAEESAPARQETAAPPEVQTPPETAREETAQQGEVKAAPPAAPPAAPSAAPPSSPVRQERTPAQSQQPVQGQPPVQRPEPSRSPAPEQRQTPERPVTKGALAFVLDDAGNNLNDLDPFLKIPGALTIAVLPGLPNSVEAARRIRAAGKEVFLHQPMESLGGTNPGPSAIRSGMGKDEIKAIVNRNLDELWPVAGINNHEGSRITMDDEAMETVLAICRERGIVFLDSRTTAETAAPRVAKRMGMTIGERDVFIDNIQERESMLGYINTGLARAEQKGSAIMIGHVSTSGLASIINELYPSLREQGFPFSPASALIRGSLNGINPAGINPAGINPAGSEGLSFQSTAR